MLLILHGVVTDEQLDAQISKLLDGQFNEHGTLGLCVICKNVSTKELSFKAIFSAGKRMKKATFRKNGKLAFVAKSTVSFGLAKIYQKAAAVPDLDEMRVVRGDALESAIAWMNVEDFSGSIKHQIERYEQISEYSVN